MRLVENGETFEVTDRGRPVAVLGPLKDTNPLERLRAAGEVSTPTETLDDLPPPLTLRRGQPRLSVALARLRSDER